MTKTGEFVLVPPSAIKINGVEYELHHDFCLESIVIFPKINNIEVRLNNHISDLSLFIGMRGVKRLNGECINLNEDVDILTMIGWTHKAYPEDFNTFSLIEDPGDDWDLTMVFGDVLNFKFGGGQLTVRMESLSVYLDGE